MQIRQATEVDIPGILNVLKASLGETSSKKTEEIWRYKHIDNPFGESLVLVAEVSGLIIGVRAFMRWQWKKGGNVYSALRAVDTATHPDHQGKGIFKKLTLAAIKLAEENKDQFVFNTPNAQSKPGYLKMGWREVGKLHTNVIPTLPFYWNFKKPGNYQMNWVNDNVHLMEFWNKNLESSDLFFTPKSIGYLDWRYRKNPIQNYRIEASPNYFIAGYVKNQNAIKELRITELISLNTNSANDSKSIIKKWAKEYGVHFISLKDPIKSTNFKLKISGNFGPTLTLKNLEIGNSPNDFFEINNWGYSLGDLELF